MVQTNYVYSDNDQGRVYQTCKFHYAWSRLLVIVLVDMTFDPTEKHLHHNFQKNKMLALYSSMNTEFSALLLGEWQSHHCIQNIGLQS